MIFHSAESKAISYDKDSHMPFYGKCEVITIDFTEFAKNLVISHFGILSLIS